MNKSRRCKIDWFFVINDINKKYSFPQIEVMTGIPASTIHSWKQGGEPKYSDGDKMIDLWCAVTGRDKEAAPRVTRHSYHF